MDIDSLRSLLGWCTIFNSGLLLFWAVCFIFCRSFIHSFHGRMFEIPATTMNAIHYSGMLFFKIVIFVFNLVPYLALRFFAG